jgi:hypothetical protein
VSASQPPADGFCPTCTALDDEACHNPDGSPRENHKRRHPSPVSASQPLTGDELAAIKAYAHLETLEVEATILRLVAAVERLQEQVTRRDLWIADADLIRALDDPE